MLLSEIQFGIIVTGWFRGGKRMVGMVKGVRRGSTNQLEVLVEWEDGYDTLIHPTNLERYED